MSTDSLETTAWSVVIEVPPTASTNHLSDRSTSTTDGEVKEFECQKSRQVSENRRRAVMVHDSGLSTAGIFQVKRFQGEFGNR